MYFTHVHDVQWKQLQALFCIFHTYTYGLLIDSWIHVASLSRFCRYVSRRQMIWWVSTRSFCILFELALNIGKSMMAEGLSDRPRERLLDRSKFVNVFLALPGKSGAQNSILRDWKRRSINRPTEWTVEGEKGEGVTARTLARSLHIERASSGEKGALWKKKSNSMMLSRDNLKGVEEWMWI